MNINSLILIIIVIIFCLSIIPLRIWGRKIYSNYFFWFVPNILFLSYFIIFRFIEDWIGLNEMLLRNEAYVEPYIYSITYSKALLLDLCPFVAILLPILLILFKNRNLANIIAPFAIFGGLITLFGGVLFDNNAKLTIDYILFGYENNEIYFMMHAYLLINGIMVLVTCNNKKIITILWSHIFALIYFMYILTLSKSLNITWNVTGIVPNDWLPGGQYQTVSNIFNLQYPYVMIVSLILAYIFINITILSNILINRRIKKKTQNHLYQLS
ncbi:MAG: DUF5378 family protein [Malacoplasma sp.]